MVWPSHLFCRLLTVSIIFFLSQSSSGDDYVTKSQNRKSIHVTSSSECQKHNSVDLSDYNRYLNQIWYRTQIPHYQHAGMAKFTYLKIQDGGRRHLGFLGYVKRKMSNSGLDKDICIIFYGIMHWTLTCTTTVITDCIWYVVQVVTVWMVVSCSNNFSTKLGSSGWLGYGSTSKIMRTT